MDKPNMPVFPPEFLGMQQGECVPCDVDCDLNLLETTLQAVRTAPFDKRIILARLKQCRGFLNAAIRGVERVPDQGEPMLPAQD